MNNCDLCGSDKNITLWDKEERINNKTFYPSIITKLNDKEYHLKNVMCLNCGLVYTNPRMSDEELNQFYKTEYRKLYNKDTDETEHADNAYSILEQLKFNNFLDIGCNKGELINKIQVPAYGIEPNLNIDKSKITGTVYNCMLEDFKPDMEFDMITMLNTLEHLSSPTKELEKIRTFLKGYLLISVPDLMSTNVHIPPDAFLSCAHVYHFDINSITKLVEKCGYKTVMVYIFEEQIGNKLYLLLEKAECKPIEPLKDPFAKYRRVLEHLIKSDLLHYTKLICNLN